MTISLKHSFASSKSDGTDSTLVRASNWNNEHTLTMATSRVMGRLSSGVGVVEELTSAQMRSFLQQSVTVKDYGAVGDGVVDDTVAINSALSGGAKTVYFPPGSYKITGYLRLYANTKVELDHNATILNYNSTNGLVFLNGQYGNTTFASGYTGPGNIWITGGTINNAPAAALLVATEAIAIAHAANVLVENMRFLNNYDSHFVEFNASKNVVIRNCYFDTLTPATAGTREMINIDYSSAGGLPAMGSYDNTVCKNILVTDNVFLNGDLAVGTHSAPAGTDADHIGIEIRSNYIADMTTSGIAAQFWTRSVVDGNTLERCGQRSIKVWGGSRVTVSNNTIKDGSSVFGITVDDASSRTPESVDVVGNTVIGSGAASIFCDDCSNVRIMRNTVVGAGTDGIYAGVNASKVEISSNAVRGASQSSSGTYMGIKIAGTNVSANNNLIDHGSYATQYKYGIEAQSGASGSCYMASNRVTAGVTGSLSYDSALVRLDGTWVSSLATDTAVSLPWPTEKKQGLLLVSSGSTSSSSARGLFWARTDATPVMSSIAQATAADVVLTTGALTGTTGTATKVTLSAASDGKVYLENRSGVTRVFAFNFISH